MQKKPLKIWKVKTIQTKEENELSMLLTKIVAQLRADTDMLSIILTRPSTAWYEIE